MDAETKALYRRKAAVAAALGHPLRLAVVEVLRDGEQCVCDIAARLGAQRSNVSRHLAVMVRAGVLVARKDGLRMLYTLRAPCAVRFLDCVADVLREQMREDAAVLEKL